MFRMPEQFSGEAERLGDEAKLPEGASEGTAQIHRAGKGMIYFTMQDGRENRTVLLNKRPDGKWEAKVKPKKFSVKAGEAWLRLEHIKEPEVINARLFKLAGQLIKSAQPSLLENDPRYQATTKVMELLKGKAGAPLRFVGNTMAHSPAGSAALGTVLGGGLGAGAGALLAQLGYENRVTPAENAIRLGGLGAGIGGLLMGGGSWGLNNLAQRANKAAAEIKKPKNPAASPVPPKLVPPPANQAGDNQAARSSLKAAPSINALVQKLATSATSPVWQPPKTLMTAAKPMSTASLLPHGTPSAVPTVPTQGQQPAAQPATQPQQAQTAQRQTGAYTPPTDKVARLLEKLSGAPPAPEDKEEIFKTPDTGINSPEDKLAPRKASKFEAPLKATGALD
jgi:hypothetical protein